jgi:hypothetical protein
MPVSRKWNERMSAIRYCGKDVHPRLAVGGALFFLNAVLSLDFPAAGAWGASVGRLSPELLILLCGMCLTAGEGRALHPWAGGLLTASVMALRLFHCADTGVPMIFNRPFNLYLDSQRLPDLLRLFWQTRPPAGTAGAAAAALLGAAILSWSVWKALNLLRAGLSSPALARFRFRLAAAAAVGAVVLTVGPEGLASIRGPRILLRATEEIGFILNLNGTRAHHRAAIDSARDRARRMASGLDRLHAAPVLLIVIESYGMSAMADPRLSAAVLPAARTAEAELRAAGFEVASAFLDSPTFGGASWLAHGTLASGVRLDSQIRHDLLLDSDLVPLAEYFNRAGYRTVRAMPGTQGPWPAGVFYRYAQAYYAADFGYRGPAFGFAAIPDQYVLDWVYRREVRPKNAPLFVEIVLTGSHAAFDVQAPYLEDWDRIGDGSVFLGLTPVVFPVSWTDLSEAVEAYRAAIVYEINLVADFIRRFLDGSELVIVLGDHQPCAELIGEQPAAVPVHVVSANPEFIREFTRRGYTAGMVPAQPPPHPGMETLFWDVLEGFSVPQHWPAAGSFPPQEVSGLRTAVEQQVEGGEIGDEITPELGVDHGGRREEKEFDPGGDEKAGVQVPPGGTLR